MAKGVFREYVTQLALPSLGDTAFYIDLRETPNTTWLRLLFAISFPSDSDTPTGIAAYILQGTGLAVDPADASNQYETPGASSRISVNNPPPGDTSEVPFVTAWSSAVNELFPLIKVYVVSLDPSKDALLDVWGNQ